MSSIRGSQLYGITTIKQEPVLGHKNPSMQFFFLCQIKPAMASSYSYLQLNQACREYI